MVFATQNAGKRMVAVDLSEDGGSDVVLRLVEGADVFVEGFAPGTAERMGLGFDQVRARQGRIVYASLSAFGDVGPYAGRPGFDHIVQAVSGIMPATGFPGQPPTKVGSPYLDYGSGLLLAFAVLAGLRERDRTDRAVQVDVAMLDAGLMLNVGALVRAANLNEDPPRTGNDAFSRAVASGAFETSDGLLSIAANKVSHYVRLCDELGLDDLADRVELAMPGADPEAVAEARARFAEVFATATAQEWEQRLTAARVPAARVRSLTEVVEDGHPTARQMIQPVPTDDGELLLPGLGVRINGSMNGPTEAAAACGADTDAVLAEAGFEAGAVAKLRARGIVA